MRGLRFWRIAVFAAVIALTAPGALASFTPTITWAPTAGLGTATSFTATFNTALKATSASEGTNVYLVGPATTAPACNATRLTTDKYAVTAGTSVLTIAPTSPYSWSPGLNYTICLTTGIQNSSGSTMSSSASHSFIVPAWNSAITWSASASPYTTSTTFTATFGTPGASGITNVSKGNNAYLAGPGATIPACDGSAKLGSANYSITATPATNPTGLVFAAVTPYLWGSGSSYSICLTSDASAIRNSGGVPLGSGSAGKSFSFTMPAFLVSSVNPAADSGTGAAIPLITVSLSYPVNSSASTLTNVATLTDVTANALVANLSGSVASKVLTLSGIPAAGLTDSHTYQVSLNCSNIADTTGSASHLSGWSGCTGSPPSYSWQFSREQSPPAVGTITSKNPSPVVSGGVNWLANATPRISIPFNEAMLASTVTSGTGTTGANNICLVSGASASSCSNKLSGTTLSYSSSSNTATLQSPSLSDGSYTVYVGTGALSASGIALAAPVSWSFTVDKTAPAVSSITPADNAENIGTNVPIAVKFSEAGSGMNLNSLNNVTVADQNGNAVPCSRSYNASTKTLTLTSAGGLNSNSTYTVSISGNVADLAGNPMTLYSASFSTTVVTAGNYTAYPSFMCSTTQPNVLVILDNSNSFDTDMYGNAVGSPHCLDSGDPNNCSKSVLARQALVDMANTYGDRLRLGLMSYQLPADIASNVLFRNHFFVSYNPKSYCQDPPQACQNYCVNEEPKSGTYTMSAD